MTFTLPPKVLNPIVKYKIDGEVYYQLDIIPTHLIMTLPVFQMVVIH